MYLVLYNIRQQKRKYKVKNVELKKTLCLAKMYNEILKQSNINK